MIDAITHESIHDAILKNLQGEVDEGKLTSYWKYDNVQDYVEFWAGSLGSEDDGPEYKPIQRKPSKNWRNFFIKLLATIIVFLMITAVLL